MAYRQYVGARYVPLYDGRWDATKNYEPLTIVDDANGNSYTSKKDVPAGTELTNREYWVQTSSFSGAITQLQERMSDAENNINTIEDEVAAIESELNKAENNINTIEDEVAAIESELNKPVNRSLNAAEIFLITDSFGQNPEGNIITGFQGCVSGTINSNAQGGANFDAFAATLQNWTGNKDSIKSIILAGGTNLLSNPAGVAEQFANVKTAADGYKNATVFVAFVATIYANAGRRANVQPVLSEVIKGCEVNGFVYLGNFTQALYPTFITLMNDGTHPNGAGGNRLGSAIFNKYANDKMEPLSPAYVTATDVNGVNWTLFTSPDGSLYAIADGTTTAAIGSGSFVDIPVDTYYMAGGGNIRSASLPLPNGGAFVLGLRDGRLKYYYAQNASGQGTLPSGSLVMPQAVPLVYFGGLQETTNL